MSTPSASGLLVLEMTILPNWSKGPVIIYREGGGGDGANKGRVTIFYAEV